jgi:hypothetical protein
MGQPSPDSAASHTVFAASVFGSGQKGRQTQAYVLSIGSAGLLPYSFDAPARPARRRLRNKTRAEVIPTARAQFHGQLRIDRVRYTGDMPEIHAVIAAPGPRSAWLFRQPGPSAGSNS